MIDIAARTIAAVAVIILVVEAIVSVGSTGNEYPLVPSRGICFT